MKMRTSKVTAKGIKYARTLKDLKVGQTAYCVPWAYNPKDNSLDLEYEAHPTPSGTGDAKVTKTLIGYSIDLSKSYFEF